MQDVAPRAVRIADAIDAMICTIHFQSDLTVCLSPLCVMTPCDNKKNRVNIYFF